MERSKASTGTNEENSTPNGSPSGFRAPSRRERRTAPRELVRWFPTAVFPTLTAILAWETPSWVLAWLLAASLFLALKWVTLAGSKKPASAGRLVGYVLLWPGMNADAFLTQPAPPRPPVREWMLAIASLACGAVFVVVAVQRVHDWRPLFVGWMGLLGLGLFLLFGVFHLLSILWRLAGVCAKPIMNAPLAATSLDDYWGDRWNRAFSDVASRHLFRPGIRRLGKVPTLLGIFLFSGLVHETVISVPPRGGWGLPTTYFLIQALGLVFERSRLGRRWRLDGGMRGRFFSLTVVGLPLPLLVHAPFLERVIVPMLEAAS